MPVIPAKAGNPGDMDQPFQAPERRLLRHSRESGNPSSRKQQREAAIPTTSQTPTQAAKEVPTPAGLQLVQTGCELWLFQERKVGNLDCTFCLDCIQACPNDNVGIQLRAPTSEFRRLREWHSGVGTLVKRTDIAALVIVLVFAAFVNAFGMVAPVYALEQWLAALLGVRSEPLVLGVVFLVGLIAFPFALVTLAAWSSRALVGGTEPLGSTVTRYSFALVPIGFGMWLAHYGFHLFIGALTAVPVMQSFLADFGLLMLGDPRWELAGVVPDSWLVPLELLLLRARHARLSDHRLPHCERTARRSIEGHTRSLAVGSSNRRSVLYRSLADDATDGDAGHDSRLDRAKPKRKSKLVLRR